MKTEAKIKQKPLKTTERKGTIRYSIAINNINRHDEMRKAYTEVPIKRKHTNKELTKTKIRQHTDRDTEKKLS